MGISKHDKRALADLFIDMGVPLMVAMQTVEAWSDAVPDAAAKAQNLAKLLNVSVDFATKITKKLEIRDAYMLEAVRGKIIRIVTPIIAETYVAGGETPSDESLKALTDLFDVLISFSDSVTPGQDDKDKPHHMAVMIEACEPVVSVLRDHSFGLSPEKAFHDIIDGLLTRVTAMASSLGIDDPVRGGLMKAVAAVYASCYRAAIARIESGQDISGEAALSAIWTDCDERLALMRGLTSYVGDNIGLKPQTETMPVSKPVQVSNEPVKPDTSVANDAADEGDEGDDFNPMAFFGKGG